MNSTQAKKEFEVRYYQWAKSEFRREIDNSFENFKSFKSSTVLGVQEFMGSLAKNEQQLLASAVLKRFHPGAVITLNESLSAEELSLRNRFDAFRTYYKSDYEKEITARKVLEEKVKFLSKRNLLKIVAQVFQDTFSECREKDRELDADLYLQFEMQKGEWLFYTSFWFGRTASQLNYSHAVTTKQVFTQIGANGPYQGTFVIESLMSFCSWLGICSQTEWTFLQEVDMPIVSKALLNHCGNFFEAAPMMLKGLEVNSVG